LPTTNGSVWSKIGGGHRLEEESVGAENPSSQLMALKYTPKCRGHCWGSF